MLNTEYKKGENRCFENFDLDVDDGRKITMSATSSVLFSANFNTWFIFTHYTLNDSQNTEKYPIQNLRSHEDDI